MRYIITLKNRTVEIELTTWDKATLIEDYLTVWRRDTPNDSGYQAETLSDVLKIEVETPKGKNFK